MRSVSIRQLRKELASQLHNLPLTITHRGKPIAVINVYTITESVHKETPNVYTKPEAKEITNKPMCIHKKMGIQCEKPAIARGNFEYCHLHLPLDK